MKGRKMDKEEKLLAEAYDQGLIKLEDPSPDLMRMLKEAGYKTFKKDKRINIRLSSHDLLGIQQKAAQKGIPYQAFISGLIHQYVEGDLVEESHAKYRRK
jgi:predicted DNA binding CopG/RHH family protein